MTYTISETSISVQDANWDNGFEFWNINVASNFPTPPMELVPGETITLSVSFTSGGTVAEGNPGAQFQYWVDDHAIDPQFSYFYLPWSPTFDGATSTTYSFVVKGLGGELLISAFWWNCAPCSVNWVYRPG